jgi:ribonuclease HII
LTLETRNSKLETRNPKPNLAFEQSVLTERGPVLIAGVDEAGRGALAGPVVAAAVILPLHDVTSLARLTQVNDSKQLTSNQRETLFALIQEMALTWGVGQVEAREIDQMGILPATKEAMRQAIMALNPVAGFVLVDGNVRLKNVAIPQQTIIRGDQLSLTVAAASIIAKVTRDRTMITHAQQYPAYQFEQHKGYGTPQHLSLLAQHGPSTIHRYSFAPVRTTLF